jgi:hypothetical protein
MSYHKSLVGDNLHVIHRWSFTDEANRLNVSGVVPEDIGKVGRQEDDNSFWVLTSDSPVVWAPLTAVSMPWSAEGSSFTASSNRSYLIDSGIIVTLPASPSNYDIIRFCPLGNMAALNSTIARNGKTIMGGAEDLTLDTNQPFSLLYYNNDWKFA